MLIFAAVRSLVNETMCSCFIFSLHFDFLTKKPDLCVHDIFGLLRRFIVTFHAG